MRYTNRTLNRDIQIEHKTYEYVNPSPKMYGCKYLYTHIHILQILTDWASHNPNVPSLSIKT